MREEWLTHLASIGGQLAGSSYESVLDEVKKRLTACREQRRAGYTWRALERDEKNCWGYDTDGRPTGPGAVFYTALSRSCSILVRFFSGFRFLPSLLPSLTTPSSSSHSYLVQLSRYSHFFMYSPPLYTILRLRR